MLTLLLIYKSFNQFSINHKGKLRKSEFRSFLISIIGENDEKKNNNNNFIDNFLDKEEGERLSIDKIEFRKMLSLDKSDITQLLLSNNNNNNNPKLSQEDIKDFEYLMNRLEKICELARERNVKLLIDAEQTYFQPAIDFISMKLASKFNKSNHQYSEEGKLEEKDEGGGGGGGKRDAIVFNTYQMYLKDSFSRLKRDLELSRRGNFVFASKLVRGAYMVGEKLMAQKYGYPSPIHDNIEDTHKSYNEAVEFLLNEVYKKRKENSNHKNNNNILSIFIASHNQESVILACNKMKQFGIDANSGVVNFGQLYGMSDHITYTLASYGYPVYKYVAYGKINEVIPFLIRRAQENSSIFDSRITNERKLLWNELINRFKFRKTYELTN
ncbi:hypothetical protein Glove_134g35 [Diversispora epigaea]|uniref:Proline dehydrogenase n=1 Tax=Diversispora epigaea TaxID=1348612 RepID=A0A397J105_9GLOM|nr:hypothetical protein Glove_134g35 [Diversispora epigaea]